MTSKPATNQRSPGVVARALDALQAQGRCLVTAAELAQNTGITLAATKQQLQHLTKMHVQLVGKPTAYLLTPPEYRSRGAPPVSWWLDAYLRLKNQPYYVGLLSAAESYGSSQQAVQVTQVLTTRPTGPIELGLVRVEFYVKKNLVQTLVRQPAGMRAPLAVSSPETTVLDLIAYSHRIGGIGRAAQVISGMKPSLTLQGLRAALQAEPDTAVKQRLGYLFHVLGWDAMATEVARFFTKRLAAVVLQPRTDSQRDRSSIERPWYVIDNIDLKGRLE